MVLDKSRARDLIFGSLIFMAIMISFQSSLTIFYADYNIDPGNVSLTQFDQIEKYEEISSNVTAITEDQQVVGINPLDSFITGTFSAVKFLFNIPSNLATIVNQIGSLLEIPGDILLIIVIICSFIVTFTILEVIIRGGQI